MKNENLYYKSVDILLDAYNAGELAHGSCQACAVGNLVRANGGFSLRPSKHSSRSREPQPAWSDVFITFNRESQCLYLNLAEADPECKKEIEQTGYTAKELARIEFAFETSVKDSMWARAGDPVYRSKKEEQFVGLCAVLDVLKEIHQTDTESHEASHTRLETIYKKLQVA